MKILVRDISSGEYGHAELIEAKNNRPKHYKVRLLNDYGHLHMYTVPSFFIFYEIIDAKV